MYVICPLNKTKLETISSVQDILHVQQNKTWSDVIGIILSYDLYTI